MVLEYIVNWRVALAGTVESFIRNDYTYRLADFLSIPPEDITLQVSAASVIVDSRITAQSAPEAEAITASLAGLSSTSDASAALGVQVDSIQPADTAFSLVPVPSPPPAPPCIFDPVAPGSGGHHKGGCWTKWFVKGTHAVQGHNSYAPKPPPPAPVAQANELSAATQPHSAAQSRPTNPLPAALEHLFAVRSRNYYSTSHVDWRSPAAQPSQQLPGSSLAQHRSSTLLPPESLPPLPRPLVQLTSPISPPRLPPLLPSALLPPRPPPLTLASFAALPRAVLQRPQQQVRTASMHPRFSDPRRHSEQLRQAQSSWNSGITANLQDISERLMASLGLLAFVALIAGMVAVVGALVLVRAGKAAGTHGRVDYQHLDRGINSIPIC